MDIIEYRAANRRGHPDEDSAVCGPNRRAWAVADGVTRDRYRPDDFPDRSGAAQAARLFCDVLIGRLDRPVDCAGNDPLAAAFDAANAAIRHLNHRLGITARLDYGEYDYYGTVGAAVHLCAAGHLHLGAVGDCVVRVYDSAGALRLELPDGLADLRHYLATHPAAHDEGGRPVGYGVLTGEPAALAFVRTARCTPRPGDRVVMATDGCLPLLDAPAFRERLRAFPVTDNTGAFRAWIATYCAERAAADSDTWSDDQALLIVTLDEVGPAGTVPE